MHNTIIYSNTISLSELHSFMVKTKDHFEIPLDSKVNIRTYAEKLHRYSSVFVGKINEDIVGVLCCYLNRPPTGYISHICIYAPYQGLGILRNLFNQLKLVAIKRGCSTIMLEVDNSNIKAQTVYKHLGFHIEKYNDSSMLMSMCLNE